MARRTFLLAALVALTVHTGSAQDARAVLRASAAAMGANTVKVSLAQDGEKLNGLFKSQQGQLPFVGTITGNEVKFAFSVPFQGQPIEITMLRKLMKTGETP